MYQVFRNRRVQFSGQYFMNFELARQALRRHIRQLVKQDKNYKFVFSGNTEWDHVSRNPVNYTVAGYRILKVA